MTGNIIACGGTKEVIDEPIQESVIVDNYILHMHMIVGIEIV